MKILNKITENLTNYQEISNTDIYLENKISLEEIEQIFDSLHDYKIEFVRSEEITYN